MDVIEAISDAIEVLEGSGNSAGSSRVGRSVYGLDLSRRGKAAELILRYEKLPSIEKLVIRGRLVRNMAGQLDEVISCLVLGLATEANSPDVISDRRLLKFGTDGLAYWIRHWMTGTGSANEAAQLYGKTAATHRIFWREVVKYHLDQSLKSAAVKILVDV